jgi:hypothetical protein
LATYGTEEEFLSVYDPRVTPFEVYSGGSTVLFGAVKNPDPVARVNIAMRLLDDGANATAVSTGDNVNVLHVLWGRFTNERDVEREPGLVARLLDGGADINLRSPRFGTPLTAFSEHYTPEEYQLAIWEVVIAHSTPDLWYKTPRGKLTVGEQLMWPVLKEKVEAYLACHGPASPPAS